MARNRKPANPNAESALDSFKMEVASELGIAEKVRQTGWQNMSSADCGRVGGHMVRKMIESYESKLAGTSSTQQSTENIMTAQHNIGDR